MVDTIWGEARRRLEAVLPEKDFAAWVAPLRATAWVHNQLTIEAPSGFFRDWLKKNHLATVEQAVSAAARAPAAVRFVVNTALAPAVPPRAAARRASPAAAPPPDPAVDPTARFTFDTFVVGASNEVAYNAARAVVASPGARFNPLFVYGGVGLGKTHLLSATGHALGAGRRRGIECLSAEAFVNEMIVALRRDGMERFRDRFRRISTLIVDDVQFLGGKVRSQEEFTHTFNALHDGQRQIVLASDRPPAEIPGIEETLRNRFASGLLVDVQPPDPALRLALVERKAAARGLACSPEVIAYLAHHWCENVRELEGALTRIDALRALTAAPITVAMVRQAIAPYARTPSGRASVGRIVGEVCRAFRVTRADLTSPRRTARVALARHVTMWLCRRHTEVSLDGIGAELGGRDHSTVVHGLRTIERRLAADAELREQVRALEARIGG
jgi:chromosomal replication initiator protein